jgi:hypothetical protein
MPLKCMSVLCGFGNTVQYSSGVGTVAIPCKAADGTTDIVRLERVLYFPDLPYNLISVQEVVASGCSIIFSADNSRIQLPDEREIKLLAASHKRILLLSTCILRKK